MQGIVEEKFVKISPVWPFKDGIVHFTERNFTEVSALIRYRIRINASNFGGRRSEFKGMVGSNMLALLMQYLYLCMSRYRTHFAEVSAAMLLVKD